MELDDLKVIAAAIAAQFGSNTEVLIHDFTKDLNHSIVYIVNGHVTGRTLGGCATNLFFKYINLEDQSPSKLRYITRMPDGRTLRSSTVNFFDSNGKVCGSLCINQDISDLLLLEKSVKGLAGSDYFNSNTLSGEDELYSSSIQELLDSIIADGISLIGTTPKEMNKDAKIRFLSFLDERGVFLIQKSGVKICELLDISKFTLYSYLEEARKHFPLP
ncbi:MAG: helix-turn-helix transcriptional regulator [Lachnospiraceae bacterium]